LLFVRAAITCSTVSLPDCRFQRAWLRPNKSHAPTPIGYAKWDAVVEKARRARNELVHTGSAGIDEDTHVELGVLLMELTDALRAHGAA